MKKIVAYRCVCVPQLNWRAITITEEDRSLSSAVSHSLFLKMAPAVPLDVRVKSSVVSGIIEVLGEWLMLDAFEPPSAAFCCQLSLYSLLLSLTLSMNLSLSLSL